ncbi:MAG: N-acetylmuramoyl-L-alanine amidase [Rubrivivax sp.]
MRCRADKRTVDAARRCVLRGAGALLSLGAWHLAHGATILAVRMWPAPDYTRLTLESDVALRGQHLLFDDGPRRLVIDIDDLTLDDTLRNVVRQVRVDDPYVADIRVSQPAPGKVRLELLLKQPIVPQQFALTPVAPYRHRLVFDLIPTVEPDPLLALVREKEAAERQAARAVDDALGDFIGRLDQGAMQGAPTPGTTAPPAPGPGSPTPAPGASAVPTPGAPSQTPAPHRREALDRVFIVTLDPGHGGEDPGAIGPGGLREKDVVLQIARQLRDALHARRGVRVLMTRDADFFVPLGERVRKARRVQADLFVSIHADAFMRADARGGSVFALSTGGATSAAARWMAERENGADQVGGINLAVRDDLTLRVMADMGTTAQIRDSLQLGQQVLSRMRDVGRLHKPRVEQAGFAVLKSPEIPSILVETAFISNPEEEALLRSPQWQARMVAALAEGIRRHLADTPRMPRQRRV